MTSFLARLRLKPRLQCEDLGQHLKQQSNLVQKKNAPKDWLFFCSNHVNSVCLFVHLSCSAYFIPIQHSNKLILCLCWDTDGWYIFLGRQYNIRSGISPHPSPRLLPDGDPISQTEGRPLEMVALILRCSPLMLDNESGNEMSLDQSQASIQVTWSVWTNESPWCLIMSLGCNERRRTDTLPGAARLRLLYSLLSWQMGRTKQSQIYLRLNW